MLRPGLDVFESEPAIHPEPRTVLLAHVGSAPTTARRAMGRLVATAAVDVLAGRRPADVVTA